MLKENIEVMIGKIGIIIGESKMLPKNDLFNFFVEQAKREIEDEILKNLLEFYDVRIEEISPLPEDRDRWDKQKRFKVIYFPKTIMFNLVALPVFQKEFTIDERDLIYEQ